MIGFGADNASVMLGARGGLGVKLHQECSWLAIFGCICHFFALCATAACQELPKTVVTFAHDVYKYVSSSPKRFEEFKNTQLLMQVSSLLSSNNVSRRKKLLCLVSHCRPKHTKSCNCAKLVGLFLNKSRSGC